MFHRGVVVILLLVVTTDLCGCRTESGAMEVLCESPQHVDLKASKNIAKDSWLWFKDRLKNRTISRWHDKDLAGRSRVDVGRAMRERAAGLGLINCPLASVYDLELDAICKKKPNDDHCRLERRIINARIRKLGRELASKNREWRFDAILELEKIGARAAPTQQNLIKLLADSDEQIIRPIRSKAAKLLIQIGPDAVYRGLKWVMTNPKISREQKTEIIRRFFKPINVMVPAAGLALKDPDHRVRGLFAEILCNLEGKITPEQRKAAARMLVHALEKEQHADVRASVAGGLECLAGAGLDREAVRALTLTVDRLTRDGDVHDSETRAANFATDALGKYPEPLVRPTLERLARKHPNACVRDSAKDVLKRFDEARRRETEERSPGR